MARIHLYSWMTLFAGTFAQLQTFSPPGQSFISYSVNIPQTTASSGSGPIYIQLISTQELQWFAWGQGSRMQGANIFAVYASHDGNNVTVSPRLGVEHVEPTYNSQAQISVLAGSGISNGVMTANIRCDSCLAWPGGSENPNSSASPWVWAVKYGQLLNSDSLSQPITIHDASGVAVLDLQKATGGASDNPFLASNNSNSAGQALTIFDTGNIASRRVAHAVLMILVFVIFFPSFALMLHTGAHSRIVDIHAFFQLFTLALAISGFGIGISLAKALHLTGTYHPIIGMVAVPALILFQPAMGFLQHRYFHRTGKKSVFAYLHRWFGRSIIVLGIVNGGLGFHLARNVTSTAPVGAIIAYSVVAGIVGLVYALVVIVLPLRKQRTSSP
ncbi:cellobiose dehydrogenase [Aspergillus flavus]|nr:cellobiose dehydrogenase [Aspergillus flavus]RAQ77869.1 cellobiose dehydrogenase [Aspergillus flavus]